MKIFWPKKITADLIEKVNNAPKLDINFAYYESLQRDTLWFEFVKSINQKTIISLSFNVRLDKNNDGSFIKSWDKIDFLALVEGKNIGAFKVVNADSLGNIELINSIKTISITQTLKNKLTIEPILSQKDTLTKLYLEKNVSALQVLNDLNKLEFLNVDSIKLDIRDICKLNLKVLQVIKSTLHNTEYFRLMHNLEQIYFYGDKSDDYGFLEHIPNLKSLAFDSRKKFVKLPPLYKLYALDHLGLEGVGAIENLEELRNCKKLKTFIHVDSINQPEDYLFLNDLNLESCKIYFKTNAKHNRLRNLLAKYW